MVAGAAGHDWHDYGRALAELRILAIRDLVSWWVPDTVLGFAAADNLWADPWGVLVATYGEHATWAAADYLFHSRSLDDHLRGREYPDVIDPARFNQAVGAYHQAWHTYCHGASGPDRLAALQKLTAIITRLLPQPAGITRWAPTPTGLRTKYAIIPGPGACLACLMAASRGASYDRDAIAAHADNDSCHAGCAWCGIAVHTPADLPRINRELQQLRHESTTYPGEERVAFGEVVERRRNHTPDWVPKNAVRVVGQSRKPWQPYRTLTVGEVNHYGLIGLGPRGQRSANQKAIDGNETDIAQWLIQHGAVSVQRIGRHSDLPEAEQDRMTAETGVRKTPDYLVDGLLMDGKTIHGPSGIKNNAKAGAKQARNIIFDLRKASGVHEEDVLAYLRRAIGDEGNKLDRMIVITQDKTYLWERRP